MEPDKIEDLKLIEFVIDDSFGDIIGDLSLISIVKSPAIERSFHLFSKQKKQTFTIADKEKQIIVGCAMTANQPILRVNEFGEYYNCWFSEDTVRKCSEIFLKNSNNTKTNLEHGELLTSNQIDGAYITQSWLVQKPENDTALSYGFTDIKKGDWFVSFKIESPKLWNIIKEQGFSGFSIEGSFSEKELTEKEIENKIYSIVYNKTLSEAQKETEIKKLLIF